ncbi:TonB-dependent receptor [Erythrobacter rubeus]|uniref:TonB-dependent receptor n=1 Tax=Erythrobacter rubeus TaxID=2760803 RepID=A0ABR8KMR5_9SPHN|nr:TonB-dependent receptor [Erythrobacter rubeus]MBD2840974.1 TonB-dependent receptor [Erythrobacter rubeus]
MIAKISAAAFGGAISLRTGAAAAAIAAAISASPAAAQVTYAEMTGEVRLEDGSAAEGASVVITHVPSGSRVSTRVNAQGRFTANGLRVGGPYTIDIRGEDIRSMQLTDLFTAAGDPLAINVTVKAFDPSDDNVIVVTGSPFDSRFGSINTYGEDEIREQTTVDRRLQEIIQRDSRAFVDFGQPEDDQGVSILGFNSRLNNLVVDGLSQQDTFGDNFTGLATRRSPISLDAIESLSVETAPFDVQNSGFQGGLINIITKSGTNEFSGSFRYQRSGGFLTGDEIGTDEDGEPIELADDPAENAYIAIFGGPIIKDKLFFFLSYEEYDESEFLGSCPFGIPCDNPDDAITVDIYDQIRAISQAQYGFDPGDFNDILNIPNGERKYLAKLDWNITDGHRAQLTLQRTESEGIDVTRAPGLDSPSTAVAFEQDVPIGISGQVFSQWTDDFSTQVQFGFIRTERTTVPLSGDTDFGQVLLSDVGFALNDDGTLELDELGNPMPDGNLAIGTDDFDQNNALDADRWQFKARGEYLLANHAVSFGYEFDRRDIFRQRAPGGSGIFQFDPITLADGTELTSIEAFEQGFASQVTATFPVSGDILDAAADFTLDQHSLFVQTDWAATDNLDLLLGLRYEVFSSDDTPPENPFFVQRYGFSNASSLDGRDVLLPRFGFNWRPAERTTLRGGAGIFAGGAPVTWFTEPFLTNGVTLATAQLSAEELGGPVDPNQLPDAILAELSQLGDGLVEGLDGDVSFIAPDFDIVRNARFSLAVDHIADFGPLGNGWRITAEAVYSDVLDALQFQDIRLAETGEILPTGTPRFIVPTDNPLDTRPGNSLTVANGSAIQDIGIFNTSEGHSLALTFEIGREFDLGSLGVLGFSAGYTYIESVDVSPANDTDDLDDVFETGAYDNVNNPTPGPSIQAVPHNAVFNLDWRKEFAEDFALSINVFGNYRSGRATSFITDANNAITPNNFEGLDLTGLELLQPGFSSRASGRLLAYLPDGPDDPRVRYAPGSSYDQIAAVEEAFDLSEFRGQFIPRNTIRAEDTFRIDLNVQLEVPSPLPGKFIFDAGMFNFLNFLDRDSGVIRRFSIRETFYDSVFDPEANQIVIADISAADALVEEEFIAASSVWRAQLGVRYLF